MPKALPELDTILHSGTLAYGKWGKEFEESLAQFIGNEKILAVNSFNAAALVALSAIGVQHGNEVIASPMSCLASNQPLLTHGAKVVWADIDPSTGTLDPQDVRRKISSKTKAIFHNHHCGYPGYIDEINAIGKEFGVAVVDDCIEAFGSEYKQKKMGNLGTDITIFSFQTVRLPNTIDGGAIAFNNEELYSKAKLIRDLGVDRMRFRDEQGEISPKCDVSIPGYGVLLSDVNSYIGLKQMSELSSLLAIQRKNGEVWKAYFAKHFPNIKLVCNRTYVSPNFWVFSLLTENKSEMLSMFRSKGYHASGVHVNNNIYSAFGVQVKLSGVSEFVSKHLALPCGWWFENQLT